MLQVSLLQTSATAVLSSSSCEDRKKSSASLSQVSFFPGASAMAFPHSTMADSIRSYPIQSYPYPKSKNLRTYEPFVATCQVSDAIIALVI